VCALLPGSEEGNTTTSSSGGSSSSNRDLWVKLLLRRAQAYEALTKLKHGLLVSVTVHACCSLLKCEKVLLVGRLLIFTSRALAPCW
jgi:hypothetical protein